MFRNLAVLKVAKAEKLSDLYLDPNVTRFHILYALESLLR